jgi:hypothetical protein
MVLLEAGDCRPEMRVRGVPELLDERMSLERLLNNPSLDPPAPPVNQADLAEARLVRRGDVFIDHRLDVAGRERMEIECAFDGDPMAIAIPDSQLPTHSKLPGPCSLPTPNSLPTFNFATPKAWQLGLLELGVKVRFRGTTP